MSLTANNVLILKLNNMLLQVILRSGIKECRYTNEAM